MIETLTIGKRRARNPSESGSTRAVFHLRLLQGSKSTTRREIWRAELVRDRADAQRRLRLRSARAAWRLESCVPQHPPEVDQHLDVNVLSVWSDKHLRLSAERHSVPAVRLLVHVADGLEEGEHFP